jgi:hypothetical protein
VDAAARSRLLDAVDAAFVSTAAGLHPWPAPHPAPHADREPRAGEHSRLLDPGRYRLVGARVGAWVEVLADRSAASVEVLDPVGTAWRDATSVQHTRVVRVRPSRPATLPLVLGLAEIDGVPEAVVTVGAGRPAAIVDRQPACGCDACDDGSDALLGAVDAAVLDVVAGTFVRVVAPWGLVTGRRNGWSLDPAPQQGIARDVDGVLAEARAGGSPYPVLRGAPWL